MPDPSAIKPTLNLAAIAEGDKDKEDKPSAARAERSRGAEQARASQRAKESARTNETEKQGASGQGAEAGKGRERLRGRAVNNKG